MTEGNESSRREEGTRHQEFSCDRTPLTVRREFLARLQVRWGHGLSGSS